jgi:crotonobetainyl-CoA:carnitine CoA-transferase CaiB-like acyl-CoA transferase
MVINCSDENGKSGQQLGFSIKLEKTPAQLRTIAPLPGADTNQILKNLGYEDAAIEELINSAAING